MADLGFEEAGKQALGKLTSPVKQVMNPYYIMSAIKKISELAKKLKPRQVKEIAKFLAPHYERAIKQLTEKRDFLIKRRDQLEKAGALNPSQRDQFNKCIEVLNSSIKRTSEELVAVNKVNNAPTQDAEQKAIADLTAKWNKNSQDQELEKLDNQLHEVNDLIGGVGKLELDGINTDELLVKPIKDFTDESNIAYAKIDKTKAEIEAAKEAGASEAEIKALEQNLKEAQKELEEAQEKLRKAGEQEPSKDQNRNNPNQTTGEKVEDSAENPFAQEGENIDPLANNKFANKALEDLEKERAAMAAALESSIKDQNWDEVSRIGKDMTDIDNAIGFKKAEAGQKPEAEIPFAGRDAARDMQGNYQSELPTLTEFQQMITNPDLELSARERLDMGKAFSDLKNAERDLKTSPTYRGQGMQTRGTEKQGNSIIDLLKKERVVNERTKTLKSSIGDRIPGDKLIGILSKMFETVSTTQEFKGR